MDALTSRLGTRFLIVTVTPNALLFAYVGFLVAAGAPVHHPSFARALTVLDRLTVRQIIAMLLGLLVISVATHPLQTPIIQFVEGYWWGLPFGPTAAYRFTARLRKELSSVQSELERALDIEEPWDWATEQAVAEAQSRQDWLPDEEQNLLPTALGNTLRTGEVRAGERYGLELDVALPRLSPLLSDRSLADLRDRRNQLDAAVRLCVAAGLATAAGIGLLLWYGPWLFLPLLTYLLCWASYRGAIAAARGFCISLAAAIDLHHLRLFDALNLERPANLARELEVNKTLSLLFRGQALSKKAKNDLRYILPKPDDPQK